MNIFNCFFKSNCSTDEIEFEDDHPRLPNEMVRYIFCFLQDEYRSLATIAEVSFQFYSVSQPFRDQINKNLTKLYEQITITAINSFYSFSSPSFCCHFDFTVQQRFFVKVNYLVDQNTKLMTLNYDIRREVLDDESEYEPNLDKSKLNDTYFVLVDEIRRKKSTFWTTTESSKVKLVADTSLRGELLTVALKAIARINMDRK